MNEVINPLFLKTFRKAYEILNFTETAKILGMTQSGVSQHIAQIEVLLGTNLFERVGKKVVPTKVAEQIYNFSGTWIQQMQDLIGEIQNGEKNLLGIVRIGAPGSFGVLLLEELIKWQKANPGLIIHMEYGPNSVMERELRIGKIDLAVTSEILDSREFYCEEFFTQEYVLISHPDLKPNFDSWDTFCKLPIIDYVGSESIFQKWRHAHYPKSTNSQNHLNIRAKINNMESIFKLVQEKVGFTIFPKEPLSQYIDRKNIKIHKTQKTVKNSLYITRRHGQILSKKLLVAHQLILDRANKILV